MAKRRIRGQETSGTGLQFKGLVCPRDEDMARQEYLLSSKISYQIQQFGIGRPGQSGEVDFDRMDLQSALELVEEAQQKWHAVPSDIRSRYGSWSGIERAAKSGELAVFLKARGASPVPGEVARASASDSAPVEGDKA